jgi:hypothetical protein
MGRRHPASGIDAFWDLEAYLSRAFGGKVGLSEIERGAETRARELVRLSMQAAIDAMAPGDVGHALVLSSEDGPVRLSHRRIHVRRVLAICGELRIARMGYFAPGHPAIHPLDARLALPGKSYSYELCRRVVRGAVCCPFDEAIAFVAEMIGTKIPKLSAETMVKDAAVDFDAFYASRTGPSAVRPRRGEILVAAIDGKGIPLVKPEGAEKLVRRGKGQKAQKKKMATVATVFSQAPVPRTPKSVVASLFKEPTNRPRSSRSRPTAKRVWASLIADKDSFFADVRAEMDRRDPRHRRTWVIVTDGERALQRRVTETFGDVTLVLDLLHVLQRLWSVAYLFHPEGSPEAAAFVRERAERILNGGVSQVVKGLRQMATKRRLRGQRAKTLHDAADYMYRNRSRMAYDVYLRNGWPIASGAVEGACKNLVRDRFERSGMRWTPEMAEPMLKLRALHLSGDFDEYWDFHIAQDQQRLYKKGAWRVVRI